MTGPARQSPMVASHSRRPRDRKYTRVAIILHWLIAALIIYNLISGFVIWDFAREFFRADFIVYSIGLTSHMSAGMTVLVLTVVRITWRLMHEPPPYPEDMKPWERHAAHFTHFFLYAVMLLMPLAGWAILSTNPPPGSAGAEGLRAQMAAMPPPAATGGAAPPRLSGPPSGPSFGLPSGPASGLPSGPSFGPPPGLPRIWWVMPSLPPITPLQDLGAEPGGVAPQRILHDKIVEWHSIGGWLMLFLVLLHVAGALKHQWIDRHPTLQRMGLGKSPNAAQEADA